MKGIRGLALLALTLAACATPRPKPPSALPSPLPRAVVTPGAPFEDSGAFTLFLDGEPIGESHFRLRTDGAYEGQAKLDIAGQTVDVGIHVEASSGDWQRITQVAPQGTVLVERHGDEAVRSLHGESTRFPLRAGARVFENYSPALLGYLVRAYDLKKGGSQSFPVFIAPIGPADLVVEKNGSAERVVNGALLKVTEYTFELAGIELKVLADAAGHVQRVRAPGQRATFVRKGSEALAATQVNDSGVSPANNDVEVQRNAQVPMRDGLSLATDLYRPRGIKRAPVILFRTYFGKEGLALTARFYARRGYVVAVEDVRGRGASKSAGTFEPFSSKNQEGEDGFDAVEWLGKQGFSTGKVGLQGAGASAWLGWWALAEKPPHLAAMISAFSPAEPTRGIPYDNGCFALSRGLEWLAQLEGSTARGVTEATYGALPVSSLDTRVLGHPSAAWRTWLAHPPEDGFWDALRFSDPAKLAGVDVPVFHQTGWFDVDAPGTELNYAAMVAAGAKNQKLLVGPWRTPEDVGRTGEEKLEPRTRVDLPLEDLRFFDHHLKGARNGVEAEPAVKLFVLGENAWLTADRFPLPAKTAEPQRWYLQSGGKAQTSLGDGVLTLTPPSAKSRGGAKSDRYVYDPVDPTPAPDFIPPEVTAPPGTERFAVDVQGERESHHAAVTSTRRDLLVFTSGPLTERYVIAGPLTATLHVESTAVDTDFFVAVLEEAPGGGLTPLGSGRVRARYRRSRRSPEKLPPGKVQTLTLDLGATSIALEPGHKLRVEISSALFPLFSRNLDTGENSETGSGVERATQTVHHDAAAPSYLEVQHRVAKAP